MYVLSATGLVAYLYLTLIYFAAILFFSPRNCGTKVPTRFPSCGVVIEILSPLQAVYHRNTHPRNSHLSLSATFSRRLRHFGLNLLAGKWDWICFGNSDDLYFPAMQLKDINIQVVQQRDSDPFPLAHFNLPSPSSTV